MIRLLMFGHDATRSGAPKIFFDLCMYFMHYFEIQVVMLKKGNMKEMFSQYFDVIYLDDNSDKNKFELATELIKKYRPDLVFANTIATYECAYAAKVNNIPVIMSVYELQDDFDYVFAGNVPKNINEVADYYVVNSELVRTYLLTKIDCADKKIIYIPCFVSSSEIKMLAREKTRGQVRKELGIPNNNYVVMNIANCTPKKGIDVYIDSFISLRSKGHNDISFVSIGAYDMEYIKTFSKDVCRIDKGFLFLGEKSNPYQYLSGADIFLFPSRSDSFGLVVLASMILEIPTIVFEQGCGLSKIVREGKYGISVENFSVERACDAIISILNGGWERGDNMKMLDMFEAKNVLPKFKKLVYEIVNNDSRQ